MVRSHLKFAPSVQLLPWNYYFILRLIRGKIHSNGADFAMDLGADFNGECTLKA